MTDQYIDQATDVRDSEQLDTDALEGWLADNSPEIAGDVTLQQFPSGHSNLTYLIEVGGNEYVLRRPPFGAENIAKGHDMSREYKVLSHLDGMFDKAPGTLAFCEDEDVIGAPFYIMERVEGVILRGSKPDVPGLDEDTMRELSTSLVRTLAEIHDVDLEESGLEDFGKPEGYVERQVMGWTKRYSKSQTDDIPAMDEVGRWLEDAMPDDAGPALIHNDFKYDNVVLNPDDLTQVNAILDWEMSTVGDPLMDLGTSLAYWIQPEDPDVLQSLNFGPTALPGNLSRREVVEKYAEFSGRDVSDAVFYYVYGLYKVAVIGQQIYYRYKEGYTDDERFAMFIFAVKALGETAARAIEYETIEPVEEGSS
jgi:aminoglycoside phosphotransferase (APT) family kinase protein